VHDQVGKAADRRGEVGVARQRQAEMAEIVGTVDRLALASEHGLVDQAGDRLVRDLVQDAVEVAWPDPRSGRQAHTQGAQKLAQALDLGGVGLVMTR
jgi:hypothetical protein